MHIKKEIFLINGQWIVKNHECIERLYEESFLLEKRKKYGFLGEHGEGGGGISWLLSERATLEDVKVNVFGKKYGKRETVKEGWCLGEGIPDMDRTAWNEIAAALKMSKRLKALENPQTGVMKPYK